MKSNSYNYTISNMKNSNFNLYSILNIFLNILDYIKTGLLNFFLLPFIINNYAPVLNALYILRLVFVIFIIVITIWSGLGGGDGTAIPLYHLYSILKSIFVILILVAGIFVVYVSLVAADKNQNHNPALEIDVIYSGLRLVPYMYDLVAILILLGILKAYYIRGCSNSNVKKNPNVYNFIDKLVWIPFSIIIFMIIANVLVRLTRQSKKIKGTSLGKITGPFMSVSFAVIIAYFVMQYLEDLLSNNIAYWMKLYDGAKSDDDCVTGQFGTDDGELGQGLDKAKNIIISVILSVIVVFILVIQLVPLSGFINLNMEIRQTLLIAIKKIVDSLQSVIG